MTILLPIMGTLIGIGGLSRAGKSTLARLLAERLIDEGYSAIVLHQDEYVIEESDLPLIRDKQDWEVPQSIHWKSLKLAIQNATQNYDIVFVEGLFAFHDPLLTEQMDHRIFIEISKSKFLERKKVDLRWGSEPEPDWYMEHIWQSYLRYGRPTLSDGYICLNGSRFFDIDGTLRAISILPS